MGFEPSKSEPDIWMRKNGNIYEYITVYVDDLAIAAKDPKGINRYSYGQAQVQAQGYRTYHVPSRM
jgi:starvation-inducible outer membrane lipoprotein